MRDHPCDAETNVFETLASQLSRSKMGVAFSWQTIPEPFPISTLCQNRKPLSSVSPHTTGTSVRVEGRPQGVLTRVSYDNRGECTQNPSWRFVWLLEAVLWAFKTRLNRVRWAFGTLSLGGAEATDTDSCCRLAFNQWVLSISFNGSAEYIHR